jgi:hypothetical protein
MKKYNVVQIQKRKFHNPANFLLQKGLGFVYDKLNRRFTEWENEKIQLNIETVCYDEQFKGNPMFDLDIVTGEKSSNTPIIYFHGGGMDKFFGLRKRIYCWGQILAISSCCSILSQGTSCLQYQLPSRSRIQTSFTV